MTGSSTTSAAWEDIQHRVLRTIGDPLVRFREDPVRILRAAKFAGRLEFSIDPEAFTAMQETAPDLTRAARPRLLEELLRLLRGGHALESYQLLRDVGALRAVLPVVADWLDHAPINERRVFWRLLGVLDHEVSRGFEPGNAVLLACLMVLPLAHLAKSSGDGRAAATLAEQVLGPFSMDLRLPRRDAGCLKRICVVQQRFEAGPARRFRVAGFVP